MTDSRRARRENRRARARLSPLTVIGELLIVAGLAVFGYIVWQPWHTGTTVVKEQTERSQELGQSWQEAAPTEEEPSASGGAVPVTAEAREGEVFAVLHAPAFGTSFANVIAEGTSEWGVLHRDDKGVGRYTNTQHFGEPGNVGLAAHRSGPFITPFREVMNLRVDDPLFIQTQDGWYVYRFRSIEYVLPTEVDVLNPFPRLTGTPGDDQILTLTTCHPKQSGVDERAIAYAVFEEFIPQSAGVPQELADMNPALLEGTGEA